MSGLAQALGNVASVAVLVFVLWALILPGRVAASFIPLSSRKAKGMINLPITDKLGARIAGVYLNRDGFTYNQYTNSRIDGRNLYSVRGTLRWEPTADTTLDLLGSYFREDDDRLRIQKQLCQCDPTGVLGCLPGKLAFGVENTNATFAPGTLTSREFLAIQGIPAAFGLGSLYGPDANTGATNPADYRTINADTNPSYRSDELTFQAKLRQRIGRLNLSLSGTYQAANVDASQDYLFTVTNRSIAAPGLNALAAAAAGQIPRAASSLFRADRVRLDPQRAKRAALRVASGVDGYGGVSASAICTRACHPTNI